MRYNLKIPYMKTTKYLAAAIIGLALFGSWAVQHPLDIKKTEWLIGSWENKTPKGSLYETWSKKSNTEFAGKSYVIQEKDTIVFETLRLVQEGNQIFYIPVVKNQNGGQPVRFEATIISDKQLVFENPKHDFPQKISYTKTGESSLTAEISGTINGKMKKQAFPMKRVK